MATASSMMRKRYKLAMSKTRHKWKSGLRAGATNNSSRNISLSLMWKRSSIPVMLRQSNGRMKDRKLRN